MASEISPGRGMEPPPTSAGADAPWCGRAERRAPDRARAGSQHAGSRMDARHLQSGGVVQCREQARQAPREHRLAHAGRAHHEQVVTAGRGELERAPRERLAAHVGEIGHVRPPRSPRAGDARGSSSSPRSHATTSVRWRAPCTGRAVTSAASDAHAARAHESLQADAPRRLGRDQRAVHRPQPAVERELAEHQHATGALAWQLIARGQDRDRHREVVTQAPSFGTLPGARLTTTRPCGHHSSLAITPARTRSRASLTARSGRPTMIVAPCSRPLTRASTSTSSPSTPIAVWLLAIAITQARL